MAALEDSAPSRHGSPSSNSTFTFGHQDHKQREECVGSRHCRGRVRKASQGGSWGGSSRRVECDDNNADNNTTTWGQLPIFRSHRGKSDKVTFSHRQRLRRAGALEDAETPALRDGIAPLIKCRLKGGVTFSERQRQRRRGLLKFCIGEDQVLNVVDQLFPGTHLKYAPDCPYYSGAFDFPPVPLFSRLRLFLQRKHSDDSRKAVLHTDGRWQQQPSVVPSERSSLSHVASVSSDSNLFSHGTCIQSFRTDGDQQREGNVDSVVVESVESRFSYSQGWSSNLYPVSDGTGETGQESEAQLSLDYEQEIFQENAEAQDAATKGRSGSKLEFKLGRSARRLLSGAIAGAVSRTAVAPLETIRTHLMVGSHGRSVRDVFQWIIMHEGWTGLFRGNAINVIRVAPSKAIELFAYETVKKALTANEGELPRIPFPVSSIAGSAAGITATVCMYPLELLKTRLTVQPDEYRGFFHALGRIVSEEGVSELYRGLVPSVIGIIPYAGVNYFAYDTLRIAYKQVFKTDHVGNLETLLIGSAAGAFASTATFPLEVARKHMQVGALKGRVVYKSTLDALSCIFKEQGLRGLYRGLGPSCLKLMPAAGISFMTYEYLKRVLLEEEPN